MTGKIKIPTQSSGRNKGTSAFWINNFNGKLKNDFKICCLKRGMTMTDMMAELMRAVVRHDKAAEEEAIKGTATEPEKKRKAS